MSDQEQSQLISVRTELVLQELVESLVAEAAARAAKPVAPEVEASLRGAPAVLEAVEPIDEAAREALIRLARAGWYARLRELERFAPARLPLAAALSEALCDGDWAAAASTCASLVAQEPLERPEPADPSAVSWRIPGPGGHVRHYVAMRAIGGSPEAVDAARALGHDDPSPLKRVWLLGFVLAEAARAREGAAGSTASDEGGRRPG